MSDEIDLIYSDLETTISRNSVTLKIQIYRSLDSDWFLEIVDEQGNSTVWEDAFQSDEAAFAEAMNAIDTEGVEAFSGDPEA